jgi:hypothetical protein
LLAQAEVLLAHVPVLLAHVPVLLAQLEVLLALAEVLLAQLEVLARPADSVTPPPKSRLPPKTAPPRRSAVLAKPRKRLPGSPRVATLCEVPPALPPPPSPPPPPPPTSTIPPPPSRRRGLRSGVAQRGMTRPLRARPRARTPGRVIARMSPVRGARTERPPLGYTRPQPPSAAGLPPGCSPTPPA